MFLVCRQEGNIPKLQLYGGNYDDDNDYNYDSNEAINVI